MSALRSLSLLLPVLSLLALTAPWAAASPPPQGVAGAAQEEREWTQPAAYHLGSYGSRLAAKIDATGRIDTGLVQARVIGTDGEPVDFDPVHVLVARLKALGAHFEGEVGVGLTALAVPRKVGADERLLVPAQLRLENLGAATAELRLGVELTAGAGTGLDRPWGAVDLEERAVFTRDGDAVLRDGLTALAWKGVEPAEVEVAEVTAPDARGALVTFAVTLEPGAVRMVEFKLAGPPMGPGGGALDDAAWRAVAQRDSFTLLEEELSWQSNYFGRAVSFYPADNLLRWLVLGGQMVVRSYGVANTSVEWLTDRPFGHEPSDAAAPAELLAALFEWGQGELGSDYLTTLLETARERGAELSPERRLAYVHALARCVRLAESDPRAEEIADLILEWVREPVAVAPWHDPADVRADLLEILADTGREVPSDFPELRWAEVSDAGSVAGRLQAQRRALAEGDRVGAWQHLQAVLDTLAPQGYGALQPGDVPGAVFAQAGMIAAREAVLDDHGGRMELFPGCDFGVLDYLVPFKGSVMPSRYGLVQPQMYYSGRARMGARVGWHKTREPETFLYHFIPSATGHELGVTEGGRVRKVDEDTVEVLEYGPFAPLGLRFDMRVDRRRAVD